MGGMSLRNFANASATGGVFYNAGVAYDAEGKLLVDSPSALFDLSDARRNAIQPTQIINIGTATLAHSNGAALQTAAVAFNSDASASGKAIRIPYNASRAQTDITTSLVMGNSLKRLGMWVYKPGSNAITACKLYFTADNFANFSTITFAVYPGLNFYVIPITNGDGAFVSPMTTGAGTGMPFGGTCTKIRIKDDNGGTGIATPALSTGEYFEVGDIFSVPPQKAKFIIGHDDAQFDLLHPGGTATIGGDGVAKIHSYLSFVASYGWRVTAYAIGGAVNNTALSYLRAVDLKECRDKWGAVIGSHSYSHPQQADVGSAASNAGLRLLGPHGYALTGGVAFTASATNLSVTPSNNYTAILNDIQLGAETLRKMGFQSAMEHFATPQGGYDLYVNQALDRMGFKTVRHINSIYAPIYGGLNTAGGSGSELLSAGTNLHSAIQTDNAAVSDADITAYVDKVIDVGGVGTNYAHSWAGSSTTRSKTKVLLDYLKTKELAGLIDVVTVEDI